MKSFKSIFKFAAVVVAIVTMSSSLTSCDVIADMVFDEPPHPCYYDYGPHYPVHGYYHSHHYYDYRPNVYVGRR